MPTRHNVRHLKRFLDETADLANTRIGTRVAEVLTGLHARDSSLFVPQVMADRVTTTFGLTVQVAGATGILPP
jgi:hypothetical protein